ncbi:YbdD/YjiX family protein [Brevibacterium ihuae]|uniref:YbdD/YjiX family protein n=1 Tax=Brevibacterium ihuae TaxID=1631743 RepID=UPI000C75A129|nr:YbdD/YjiX family protein [Brevibacterium ihuae]
MSRTAVIARIATPFRAVHWYLKEIMGENAYLHYIESYQRRHGTREGALCEREFWRDLTDEQDRNPKVRCC